MSFLEITIFSTERGYLFDLTYNKIALQNIGLFQTDTLVVNPSRQKILMATSVLPSAELGSGLN